jgi:hypothetical protein
MKRALFLLLAFVFAIGLSSSAQALQEAQAEATATAAGDSGGTDLDIQSGTASASFVSSGFDAAEAEAQSTTGGNVRSRSEAGGASGNSAPSDAFGRAAWYSDLVTTGVDPGGPIDIDLDLAIDGSLLYSNNNSGASLDDIRSSVRMQITVHGTGGSQSPFDGTAKLATSTNDSPPVLTRMGSWSDSGRDGDFTVVGCTRFSCQIDVDATISLPDTLSVDFGESFAVEVQFITTAHIFRGGEVSAEADFFNTGSVTLSTDTPGVTIEAAPDLPTPVPAFGGPALITISLLLMASAAIAQRNR